MFTYHSTESVEEEEEPMMDADERRFENGQSTGVAIEFVDISDD
jgi:hypothetical protein